MILLQLFPVGGEAISGFFGEAGRSDMNSSEGREILLLIFMLIVLYLSLTEPLKVILRKNIGRKALNLYGIFAGSSIYLTWAIVTGYFAAGALYGSLTGQAFPSTFLFIALEIYALAGSFYVGYVAFRILNNGMHEHYRAKAEDSHDWEVLEYRGDNAFLGKHFQDWKQDRIWRIAEPKLMTKVSLVFLINPIIGIPLLFTSLSFWLNEWYQVYYKPQKMKQSFLDMKIEMQKSDIYFNQTDVVNKASEVTTE